jgi:methylmalonyl-CoA mutase C-terminal domain/subunit
MTLFPRVVNLLRDEGMENVLVTGGGIIPSEDMEKLKELGVGQLFGPGTSTTEAVDYIRTWFAANRSGDDG